MGHEVGDVDTPSLTKSSLYAGTLASVFSFILSEKEALGLEKQQWQSGLKWVWSWEELSRSRGKFEEWKERMTHQIYKSENKESQRKIID